MSVFSNLLHLRSILPHWCHKHQNKMSFNVVQSVRRRNYTPLKRKKKTSLLFYFQKVVFQLFSCLLFCHFFHCGRRQKNIIFMPWCIIIYNAAPKLLLWFSIEHSKLGWSLFFPHADKVLIIKVINAWDNSNNKETAKKMTISPNYLDIEK